MPWIKISEERYENSELGKYAEYLPASESHADFWYLYETATGKPLDGHVHPHRFGIPDDVIGYPEPLEEEAMIGEADFTALPSKEVQEDLFALTDEELFGQDKDVPAAEEQAPVETKKRGRKAAAVKEEPPAPIGHNSGEQPTSIAADRLRSIIERIERLDEELKAIGSDKKDIFTEAKSAGFDVKVIRTLLRLRRLEPAEVEEQETLLDVYRRAIGM